VCVIGSVVGNGSRAVQNEDGPGRGRYARREPQGARFVRLPTVLRLVATSVAVEAAAKRILVCQAPTVLALVPLAGIVPVGDPPTRSSAREPVQGL